MCGIVGYIGPMEAQTVLINGLRKLEYRGYDSAGIAVLEDNRIQLEKKSGKLQVLVDAVEEKPLTGHTGIGHTRWATHGKPTDRNAHPHLSPNGRIAVVHNGIIENYQHIKDTYLAGHTFQSETDTEVLAHLLEVFYQGDVYQAVQRTLAVVTGAYALVVVCADHPDEIVVSRKDSPLVIGLGDGENFIASDVPALLAYTRNCIYMDSGQIARITADDVTITDLAGNAVDMPVDTIAWDEQSAEKDGYEHFMIKEIHEQPDAFRQVLSGRVLDDHIEFAEFDMSKEDIDGWEHIYIVACGTAYHSGLVGRDVLEETLGKPVFVEVASEFRYRNPRIDESCLVIVISQSGETADTLAALREAKRHGASVLAITNVVGSAVAREADRVIYLWAGPEISVASTKAYTAMLIALYMLALYMGDRAGSYQLSKHKDLLQSLSHLPQLAEAILTEENLEKINGYTELFEDVCSLFYIGRGMDWAVAQEGALKLKEISYIHAEAYAAGELKHGTLALITTETPVIAIALQQATFDKTMSNIQEVITRGADVIAVVKENQSQINEEIKGCIEIPECPDFISPILAAIPLQLLAYYTAKRRGCDIDQPRNLAKSVTVE